MNRLQSKRRAHPPAVPRSESARLDRELTATWERLRELITLRLAWDDEARESLLLALEEQVQRVLVPHEPSRFYAPIYRAPLRVDLGESLAGTSRSKSLIIDAMSLWRVLESRGYREFIDTHASSVWHESFYVGRSSLHLLDSGEAQGSVPYYAMPVPSSHAGRPAKHSAQADDDYADAILPLLESQFAELVSQQRELVRAVEGYQEDLRGLTAWASEFRKAQALDSVEDA